MMTLSLPKHLLFNCWNIFILFLPLFFFVLFYFFPLFFFFLGCFHGDTTLVTQPLCRGAVASRYEPVPQDWTAFEAVTYHRLLPRLSKSCR